MRGHARLQTNQSRVWANAAHVGDNDKTQVQCVMLSSLVRSQNCNGKPKPTGSNVYNVPKTQALVRTYFQV